VFYSNGNMGFIIKGVFSAELFPAKVCENGRGYSALSFRINGNSIFSCNGKEYSLKPGSVAYIPKGVNYIRDTKEKERLITVHFETFGTDDTEMQIIESCDSTRPFFETLQESWNANEYNKCMRIIYKIFDEIKALTPDKLSTTPKSIAAGAAYIQKSFRSPETCISNAARLCNVSETYFRRLYSAHFGKTPINALLDLRFNYAKTLLRSGYYEIKQVALLSGFSDTKYFRTAFKTKFGITPGEYAKANLDK